jgi:hypothetical protein
MRCCGSGNEYQGPEKMRQISLSAEGTTSFQRRTVLRGVSEIVGWLVS